MKTKSAEKGRRLLRTGIPVRNTSPTCFARKSTTIPISGEGSRPSNGWNRGPINERLLEFFRQEGLKVFDVLDAFLVADEDGIFRFDDHEVPDPAEGDHPAV